MTPDLGICGDCGERYPIMLVLRAPVPWALCSRCYRSSIAEAEQARRARRERAERLADRQTKRIERVGSH